jgi:transcriptional regulator GlxA family with amidase domain
VRLRRVRDVLVMATPDTTTVRLAATRFGLLHLGRFAAAYRETYGESPVETLRRPPPG